MELALCTKEELERIFALRTVPWKGPVLTEEQHIRRNRHLHSMEFGEKHVKTYVLKDHSGVLASMDIIDIDFYGSGRVEHGKHIASVIVDPKLRGKGYATEMLKRYFEDASDLPHVLYSDIGVEFYRRFGFFETACSEVEEKIAPKASPSEIESVALNTFLSEILRFRMGHLDEKSVCVWSSVDWWKWILERYRFDAEMLKKPFPQNVLQVVKHGKVPHPLAVVPEYPKHTAIVLWAYPDCQTCLDAAHSLAAKWEGISKIKHWSRTPVQGAKDPFPMVHWPERKVRLADPQLFDWW